MSDLFRPEVIKYKKHKLAGDVIIYQPLGYTFLTVISCAIIAILAIFFVLANFTRKETVTGYVSATEGVIKIFAGKQARIVNVNAEIGQKVKKGQALLELVVDSLIDADTDALEQQIKYIDDKIISLDKQKNLLNKQYIKREQELKNTLRAGKQSSIELGKKIQTTKKLIAAQEELTQRYQYLYNEDAASFLELMNQKSQLLSIEQSLIEANEQAISAERNIKITQIQLDSLPIDLERDLESLESQLLSLKQQQLQLQKQRSGLITAATDGTIVYQQVKNNQLASPGDLLLVLLPENSKNIAKLYVPTKSSGFIERGMQVRLLFDAFPYQRFGFGEGVIKTISKTVLYPQQGPSLLGITEPVYVVTVELDNQYMEAYGKHFFLQDGMTLKADIVLERRSLWQWVLDPILAMGKRF